MEVDFGVEPMEPLRDLLLARALALLMALLSIGGCLPFVGPCSGPRLDHEKLCSVSPTEQVRMWRGLYEDKVCIGHGQHFRFLDCIVKQGCAGADAVVPLLRDTKTPFLVDDAIYVVRFVHLQTCSLKNHEALEALREVTKSKLDPGIRQRASEAIQTIETTKPGL